MFEKRINIPFGSGNDANGHELVFIGSVIFDDELVFDTILFEGRMDYDELLGFDT